MGEPVPNVTIKPLAEADVADADRIIQLAFGTFLGLPDPMTFTGDAALARTRWRANPAAAFAATVDGALVGSIFAANWGSVGYFGPLSVHPDYWNAGIGQRLLAPVMDCFASWGTTLAGLCTFPQSAKHIALYQKFDFWPRSLTAIMSKAVTPPQDNSPVGWSRFADVPAQQREATLGACRALTGSIYEGLDLQQEIRAIDAHDWGDTVLLWDVDDATQLAGLALCYRGPGTEAGSGTCFVKFGAVRSGLHAETNFDRLLAACEALAAQRGLTRLDMGVNTARHEVYRHALACRYRSDTHVIIMQRRNIEGYNRPGVYLIDDWR
jgi:GNAT superfamily N-acetyltransferase